MGVPYYIVLLGAKGTVHSLRKGVNTDPNGIDRSVEVVGLVGRHDEQAGAACRVSPHPEMRRHLHQSSLQIELRRQAHEAQRLARLGCRQHIGDGRH